MSPKTARPTGRRTRQARYANDPYLPVGDTTIGEIAREMDADPELTITAAAKAHGIRRPILSEALKLYGWKRNPA